MNATYEYGGGLASRTVANVTGVSVDDDWSDGWTTADWTNTTTESMDAALAAAEMNRTRFGTTHDCELLLPLLLFCSV